MKIGIIGSGGVAQTLAKGYLDKGYEVKLGTRNAEKLAEWLENAGKNASVGSFAEAAEFGDAVFVSVAGEAAVNAVNLAGAENLKGKSVIDLTNPLDFSQGVPPRFTATLGDSLGEQIQNALPEANVVKAFNTISAAIMVDPKFGDQTATLFIAGNDENAKAETVRLAQEFGWDVEDLGSIEQAFFLEAFASLWVNYAFKHDS
ncbi:MAG TPA: NAD(P)-binding domain-containing protein, partial [Pyrinomonadaceae bacterium]|nr:NAD(P)-binding domain-containing protein [Pyrinomonadaceae bacterium]